MTLDEKVGAVELPLDAGLVGDALRDVSDPAQDILINLLKTAVESECGAAFNVAKVGTGLADGYVIGQTVPFSPESTGVLLKMKLAFPLLCVWRDTAEVDEFTVSTFKVQTDWGIAYILPELEEPWELSRLYGALNAVGVTIAATLERGKHPDYNDGYSVLSDAGLGIVGATRMQFTNLEMPQGDSLVYVPALRMTIQTVEYSDKLATDAPPYEGASIAIDLDDFDDNEDAIAPFVNIRTDHS